MEQLAEHEREVDFRHNVSDGLEVQFVWNSLISLAYTKVQDKKTGEQFTAITPDGTHPYEGFMHPYMYRVGQVATAETVLDGMGTE